MDERYVLLIEKEEMWARMLMEVLEDNGIVCAALPVYGAGLSLKTGMQEWMRVFVPREELDLAKELVQDLFSAEVIYEDEDTD